MDQKQDEGRFNEVAQSMAFRQLSCQIPYKSHRIGCLLQVRTWSSFCPYDCGPETARKAKNMMATHSIRNLLYIVHTTHDSNWPVHLAIQCH